MKKTDMARLFGSNRNTYRNWELGRSGGGRQNLYRLLEKLTVEEAEKIIEAEKKQAEKTA